jgi:hypothetical protein
MCLGVIFILGTGCVNLAPLTTEHIIPIDPALLGLWENVAGEAEGNPSKDRLVIMPWSKTEYLAVHPLGLEGESYRAYLVEIDGRTLIQAEQIGNHAGIEYPADRKAYPILSYEIVAGILSVSALNTDVVDGEIKDSAALRRAYLANRERPDLFAAPTHFRRVEDQ